MVTDIQEGLNKSFNQPADIAIAELYPAVSKSAEHKSTLGYTILSPITKF